MDKNRGHIVLRRQLWHPGGKEIREWASAKETKKVARPPKLRKRQTKSTRKPEPEIICTVRSERAPGSRVGANGRGGEEMLREIENSVRISLCRDVRHEIKINVPSPKSREPLRAAVQKESWALCQVCLCPSVSRIASVGLVDGFSSSTFRAHRSGAFPLGKAYYARRSDRQLAWIN